MIYCSLQLVGDRITLLWHLHLVRVPLNIEDALQMATHLSKEQIEMILSLVKICIENAVVHYQGTWYCSVLGLLTGAQRLAVSPT